MHANRTFSLQVNTIQELNDKVRPTLRSKFVERAIKERLNPQEIDHSLLSTRRLMFLLLSRDVSEFVKRTIAQELGVDVSGYL
jgi:hypothetical protein